MTQKDPNARIDEMGRWAKGVNDSIKRLEASLLPSLAEADAISAELGAMSEKYSSVPGLIQSADGDLVNFSHKLSELAERIDSIEADAMLEACSALGDDGKLLYTNDKTRAAAVKTSLAQDPDYLALTREKRNIERDTASTRAVKDALERSWSEYSRRNRALIARLEYFIARLG